jgi:Na+/H+ antiporter NhaD/arsenite permease-like protein
MPWGVLILFGGGLSIAESIERTGVSAWIGAAAGDLGGLPLWALVLIAIAICCFASELASNTALAATAMPILGALAVARGVPVEPLAVAAALGASLAFMLPVGTPPNAMVYASGLVRPADMAKAGLVLNVIAIALVGAVCVVVGDWRTPETTSQNDQHIVEPLATDVWYTAPLGGVAHGDEQIRPFVLGPAENLGEEAHGARSVGERDQTGVVQGGE